MNLRYINYVILRDRYVNGFSFEDALVGRNIEDIRAKSITFLFHLFLHRGPEIKILRWDNSIFFRNKTFVLLTMLL